jgi:tetratricopeptide (TPR) repeat protein
VTAPAPSAAGAPQPRARKWPLRLAVALAVLAIVGWQVRVQYGAWQQLKAGRAALERGDHRAARAHLELCLDDWPRSAEAHFLAGRAARRCGDTPAALRHYGAATGLGYDAGEVEIERAIGALSEGDFVSSEAAVRRALETKHPAAVEVLELLVPALTAEFRLHEAATAAQQWVELAPNAVRAWKYRADLLERLRNLNDALLAQKRLAELEPDVRAHRSAVVRLLLTTGQNPDEAGRLAEGLLREVPDDPAALVQLANCRSLAGRTDEAIAILEGLLRTAPTSAAAPARAHRGQRRARRRGAPVPAPRRRRRTGQHRNAVRHLPVPATGGHGRRGARRGAPVARVRKGPAPRQRTGETGERQAERPGPAVRGGHAVRAQRASDRGRAVAGVGPAAEPGTRGKPRGPCGALRGDRAGRSRRPPPLAREAAAALRRLWVRRVMHTFFTHLSLTQNGVWEIVLN